MISGSINMVWDNASNCLIPEPSIKINDPDVIISQTTPEVQSNQMSKKMPEGAITFVNTTFYRFTVKKLHEDAQLPQKARYGDLGYDLFALEDTVLQPGTVTKIRTGIACNFPVGFGALLRDRSSVATKQKVFVVAGVIDNGYTGEIIVAMFNPGHIEHRTMSSFGVYDDRLRAELCGPVKFNKGDKIAQMILTPVVDFLVNEVDELQNTERGSDGFGSTGR